MRGKQVLLGSISPFFYFKIFLNEVAIICSGRKYNEPRRCLKFMKVIPAEEHATKIRAARDAIGDADFFLIARTDARATSVENGLSDAIYRANLYMEVC